LILKKMTNIDASLTEATPVAAASPRAVSCDRDVLLPLLPVAGGLLPLELRGLAL
jgi:hypothetical protein